MAKYYLSFCLIVRDDHAYIREWVDYHRSIGVDHFYITDNKSQPPLKDTLKDYIASGLVSYKYDPRTRPQISVYNECIQQHKNDSTWIAFFDSDEFLVLKKHSTCRDFLKNYEAFGSLSVAWYVFGSNGHLRKQASILKSYTTRVDKFYSRFKTIVQPSRVKKFQIHDVLQHVDSYYTVDEKKRRVSGPLPNQHGPSTELCQLNHYMVRSYEDYIDKQRRGGGSGIKRSMEFFFDVNLNCVIEDRQILQRGKPCRVLPRPPRVPTNPPDFNWIGYLINNPGAAKGGYSQKSALMHWIRSGRRQKLPYKTNLTFNWRNYVKRYHLNNIKTEGEAVKYYIEHGKKAKHNPA